MPDTAPHDHLRIHGCYRCVLPDGATDIAVVGWAEVNRLRAELAEWEVENGMNRTFIRQEMGRLRAELAGQEAMNKQGVILLDANTEAMDAAGAEIERLRALVSAQYEVIQTVRQRIIEHNRTVRRHGGTACEDEFCRTFKPLIRALVRHKST